MEISYSKVASNNQTANTNELPSQNVQNGKIQPQSSDLEGFSAGKIFSGEILDIKGEQVSIGLDNGQILNAKLEAGIELAVGQKIFFEVESNTGTRITIKPADASLNPNPVLQKALQEANLPIADKNLEMVNNMIREGLSINKQSLSNIIRQMNANPNTDIGILVKMNKLGFEITKENIQQFENYKNYEHRIVKDIGNVANHLSELLEEVGSENKNSALQLHSKLIDILYRNANDELGVNHKSITKDIPLTQNASSTEKVYQNSQTNEGLPILNRTQEQAANQVIKQVDMVLKDTTDISKASGLITEDSEEVTNTSKTNQVLEIINKVNENLVDKNPNMRTNFIDHDEILSVVNNNRQSNLLHSVLNEKERFVLAEKLREFGVYNQLLSQVKEGKIDNKDLLNLVRTLLDNPDHAWKADSLFNSQEYTQILKRVTKEQWLIQPKDLNDPDKMSKLYKQMDEQIRHLSTLIESVGKENSNVMKDVSNIRSNLNFMEQINQNLTYLQIPIQFSNEEAHSDLYVYTNKKNLKENDGNLSVLLHLDMEVLGTTDIYINMTGKQISAKFSLQDKDAMEIVGNNLEILVERLEEKGYHLNAQIDSIEKEQDFIEDFLEKDKVVTSLKRYAFDVRA